MDIIVSKTYQNEQKYEKSIDQAANEISNIRPAVQLQPFKLNQIARELKLRGFVDFRGRSVSNTQEIAEIVAAFRYPKIEQF